MTTRKQMVLNLWAMQLTPQQIAGAIGVSASYVRAVLDAAGAKVHRFETLEEALAWLAANAPHMSEELGELRNATIPRQQQSQAA